MTDHVANLRELVGVLRRIGENVTAVAQLLSHEIDIVEHQLRDYEIVLDARTDRLQDEVVF
jgi:hypothetical protein